MVGRDSLTETGIGGRREVGMAEREWARGWMVGVAVVGGSGRSGSGSEGGAGSRRWWGVNDLLVGPALHGFPIVVELAPFGLVGEEFAEEPSFGGGVVLLRADGPGAV
eukprot:scaffold10601_cov107-Amphora_coffeaeformis.AAC.1